MARPRLTNLSVSEDADARVRRAVSDGTDTPPAKLLVLYNDRKAALVRRPGVRLGTGPFQSWVSSRVELFDLEHPAHTAGVMDGREVWDCSRDKDGPLTMRRLTALVESLGLDPRFIRPWKPRS